LLASAIRRSPLFGILNVANGLRRRFGQVVVLAVDDFVEAADVP
jgi:hypothetical protein